MRGSISCGIPIPILDVDHRFGPFGRALDPDMALFGGVLRGILNQITKTLLESRPITLDKSHECCRKSATQRQYASSQREGIPPEYSIGRRSL
jgi:hypothetical protein